jgi:hypothetical protein
LAEVADVKGETNDVKPLIAKAAISESPIFNLGTAVM